MLKTNIDLLFYIGTDILKSIKLYRPTMFLSTLANCQYPVTDLPVLYTKQTFIGHFTCYSFSPSAVFCMHGSEQTSRLQKPNQIFLPNICFDVNRSWVESSCKVYANTVVRLVIQIIICIKRSSHMRLVIAGHCLFLLIVESLDW